MSADLWLSNTNPDTILNFNFSQFPFIENLDISNNNLGYIQQSFSESLKSLKTLNLNNASLTNYNYGFLKTLTNLESLSLNYNQINSKLFQTNGQNLEKFKFLQLSNLLLASLDGFSQLSLKLVHLDASFNELNQLFFKPNYQKSLEYLDLSHNRIDGLTGSAYANINFFITC